MRIRQTKIKRKGKGFEISFSEKDGKEIVKQLTKIESKGKGFEITFGGLVKDLIKKNQEWKLRYITRLISQGLTSAEAEENYQSGEHDFNDSPEDQADDLISYYKGESG